MDEVEILGVFGTCANDLGEPMEEMSGGGWELVATDKPTILAEQFLDAIMVEDGQNDRRFANPTNTNESSWSEVFYETNDSLDQLVAPKVPRRRGWMFTRYTRRKCKLLDPLVVEVADLI